MRLSPLVLALTCSLSGFAQEAIENDRSVEQQRSMMVLISPLAPLGGGLHAKYGIRLADRIALIIPAFIYDNRAGIVSITLNNQRLVIGEAGAGLGARFFLSDEAFKSGWYIEPSVTLGSLWASTNQGFIHAFKLSASAVGGYAWVLQSGFSISLGLGARYDYVNPSITIAMPVLGAVPLSGFWPNAEISLGYSW